MSAADTYEDDLRKRLKAARELISLHEGKKIGPYVVTVELCGDTWGQVAAAALELVKAIERGPEKFGSSGSAAGGGRQSRRLQSGDEIPKDHIFLQRGYD